jgi:hypothetical protein
MGETLAVALDFADAGPEAVVGEVGDDQPVRIAVERVAR